MKNDGYLEKILTAKVYDVAIESPLEAAPAISRRTGNHILLKREDKQPVFSFKLRGAYNKMASLTPAQLARGVICASAGNHAQGVALASQRLGAPATIVMPVTTPRIKVTAVSSRGAKVELHGDSYHEAYLHAKQLARKKKLTFVHPYDDPLVIAGQGTIAVEILRQHPRPIDAIFVPVGGGGLIAGIAAYVKRVSPKTKVMGVEPVDSNAMYQSLKAGRRVTLPHVNLFADGVAVRQVGRETLRMVRELVDEIVLVDTDEICAATKDIFEDTRTVLEPAGSLALAGAKRWIERRGVKGRTIVVLATGANMNFDRLRFVAERAELGEHREAVLAVTIPERPGSFRALCGLLGKRSVTEFNYRYAPGREAHVFLGVSVSGREETQRLIANLHSHGMPAADLSDNEMAKLHGRHLVGGRAPEDAPEILYRFEFPERPGALMNFLEGMGSGWNITLFHYRNHGADVGRVLVGLQVPERERGAFRRFLRDLGYDYSDESRNPAYRFFLK
jgi:threonine dehydratase